MKKTKTNLSFIYLRQNLQSTQIILWIELKTYFYGYSKYFKMLPKLQLRK